MTAPLAPAETSLAAPSPSIQPVSSSVGNHPEARVAPDVTPDATPDVTPVLRIVAWRDAIVDAHGVDPRSRYVELYWLGIIGPSTTWLLRRVAYGLEVRPDGFDLDLADTARSLGLGDRMGRNAPFRRALARLATFDLARPQGPGTLAVRTVVPPLPLRYLTRLPNGLQRSHAQWQAERQLPEVDQMRRRAQRLASEMARAGSDQMAIEQRLGALQFHPSIASAAAAGAVAEYVQASQPGSAS